MILRKNLTKIMYVLLDNVEPVDLCHLFLKNFFA